LLFHVAKDGFQDGSKHDTAPNGFFGSFFDEAHGNYCSSGEESKDKH